MGTIIGGSLAQYNDTLGDVIIAMTSGGFLYISTVGMLPMLSKNDINLIQVLYETIGFVLGVVLMALVAIYEWIDSNAFLVLVLEKLLVLELVLLLVLLLILQVISVNNYK